MKTLILSIALIIVSQITKAQYNESRFEMTLTTTLNGKKIPLKLDNVSYTLNDDVLYTDAVIDPTAPKRQKSINVSSRESLSPAMLTIFEKKKQLVSGIIEVKDNYNKLPKRVISFDKGMYYLSENLSSYDNGSIISITISCESVTIDGIQVEK